MSGIAGLWNTDGRPVDPFILERMTAAIAHRGPDGQERHVVGSAGLAHQHLWVTREEVGEMQPLVNTRGVLLAMDGRLDNRAELLPILDLAPSVSDAACVLAAYDAWGERFPDRLNGEFAVAIFDSAQRRLLLARDSIGIRPLYYCRQDRLVAFASEIKALLAHPEIRARRDDEGIADYLLVSSRPIDRHEVTCFAGISALEPSHVAVVTSTGMASRRYWDFEPGRRIRLGSFEQYVEAFRDRFAEAVRRRIRSAHPVAISLSGGLDSSSIFCQAQKLSSTRASGCLPVFGISYVGAEGTEADERRYVDAIDRVHGIETDRLSSGADTGVLATVHEQVTCAEAPFIDLMWDLSRRLHHRAVARGARVVLTGHWGDQVLFSSAYLIDLFHRLAWKEMLRHVREHERWFGRDEARVLKRRFLVDIARHHLPRSLAPPFKWIRRHLLRVERPRSWFSSDFLRCALRHGGKLATIGEGFHSAHARAMYLEARSKYHVHCMESNEKAAALHGATVSFPFLDRDLLAFLMAIPGEIQSHGGVPRALLREAMRGILPEPVRTRRGKGDFTAMVNEGVAAELAGLSQMLGADSYAVRLGYLDPVRLRAAVDRWSAVALRRDCVDSWDLADAVGLEAWLQVFWPATPATDARV